MNASAAKTREGRAKLAREPVQFESPPQTFPVVMLSAPHGPVAEAFRALRTRLQSHHLQAGRRGLAVCGPGFEVGCSFVAANLAVAMSQIGLKTLLVDGDLRNPTIHRYFDLDMEGGGLVSCLEAPRQSVAEFVHENVQPNLDVLVAGGRVHQTTYEMLASDAFPIVMNTCLRDYDMTIVDTPPASSCADALRIGSIVGFGLIVARKNRTLVSDLRVLADQLKKEGAATVGTVLNSY